MLLQLRPTETQGCPLLSSLCPRQQPVSCPGPTELGLTHYPRRPHASRQLPKDDMPPYWVGKGYCNDGPRQKRVPQNPSPAGTQAAGQQARPAWVHASAHPVVLGYKLTACARVQCWGRDTPLVAMSLGANFTVMSCHPASKSGVQAQDPPCSRPKSYLGPHTTASVHGHGRGGIKESWGLVSLPLAESQLALPTSTPCLPAQGRVRFTC